MNSEKRQQSAPLPSRDRETPGTTPRPTRPEPEATRLPVGERALDVRREKRGIVMDHQDGFVWLRPEAGGTEWTALPADVRRLHVRERAEPLLRARVARANARSRGEVL